MQEPTGLNTNFINKYNWLDEEELRLAEALAGCLQEHVSQGCPAESNEYHRVSVLLASNPLTPAQVLDHMSRYLNRTQVLERVAANSNSTVSTLKKLAQHESPHVRSAVAEGHNLDEETVWLLARDEHVDVRYTVAGSYSAPIEVLEELSTDENPYVAQRAQLTRKRMLAANAPVEQLPSSVEKARKMRRAF
jgi:hypothetical protein